MFVQVCVCLCMVVDSCAWLAMGVYDRVCLCVFVLACVFLCMPMYACLCACVLVCLCAFVCGLACVRVFVYA